MPLSRNRLSHELQDDSYNDLPSHNICRLNGIFQTALNSILILKVFKLTSPNNSIIAGQVHNYAVFSVIIGVEKINAMTTNYKIINGEPC